MPQYSELAAEAQQIESSAAASQSYDIDLRPLLDSRQKSKIEVVPPAALIQQAIDMESQFMPQQRQQRVQQQQPRQVVQNMPVQQQQPQQTAQRIQEEPKQPQQSVQNAAMQPQQPINIPPAVQQRNISIKQELSALISQIKPAAQQKVEVKTEEQQPRPKPAPVQKPKKYILPTLSVVDQISELEKVISGISDNVFDKQQLEIIAGELQSLKNTASASQYAAHDELTTLRDVRLNQALSLLQQKIS